MRSKWYKKISIEERAEKHAQMMWDNYVAGRPCTVRAIARKTGWCKSTVHDDVTKRCPEYLKDKVAKVLEDNHDECPYRGGASTSKKWKKIRMEKNKNA